MARPPKPTALHVIEGTARPARMAKRAGEPQTRERLGRAPDWFSDRQRGEWNRIAKFPQITAAHAPTVTHHCILWDRMIQDAAGERTMTASERQTYHSIQMQLGFTPAAQAKVSVPAAPQADNPWAKLG